MSQTFNVAVPDEVYAGLAAEAAASGRSVPEVAAARLGGPPAERTIRPPSRLARWAGSAESGIPDLASRVDEYLGRAAAGHGGDGP